MKRWLAGAFFAATALVATAAWAVPPFPTAPQARVNDYAGAIPNASILGGLENRYAAFERDTGHQAVAVLVKTLDGDDIDDTANKLFEKWHLGDKQRNDGILLLVATEDHKARIEVGYGLEGQIPDVVAKRIISDDLTPFFKQNQFATALMVFENRLRELAAPAASTPARKPATRNLNALFQFLFIILIFGMPLLMTVLRRMLGLPSRTYRSGGVFGGSSWWGGWGGGGFGGGGFGGGFGGGGGLSGGGGASGSW